MPVSGCLESFVYKSVNSCKCSERKGRGERVKGGIVKGRGERVLGENGRDVNINEVMSELP